MDQTAQDKTTDEQRAAQLRSARRTALALALIAVGVYVGFIIATGMKN